MQAFESYSTRVVILTAFLVRLLFWSDGCLRRRCFRFLQQFFFVISSFDEFLISCKLSCDAVALVICPSNVTAHALESCHRHDGVRDAAVVP